MAFTPPACSVARHSFGQYLIWLTVWAQIVNALLLPMVVGFLVVLATSSLSEPNRLRGWYLGLVVVAVTITCIAGIGGAIHGLL